MTKKQFPRLTRLRSSSRVQTWGQEEEQQEVRGGVGEEREGGGEAEKGRGEEEEEEMQEG